MQATKLALEAICALAAIVAAILWFASSRVPTPTEFPIEVYADGGGKSEALRKLGIAVAKQSRLSKWAAIFAAIAALLQAGIAIIDLICGP